MRLWRCARTFRANGQDIRVITDVGMRAARDGAIVLESRPGRPIARPRRAAKMMAGLPWAMRFAKAKPQSS